MTQEKGMPQEKYMMLETIKDRIRPLDEKAMEQARFRWKAIAKPLGSLGKLEDAVVRMAGIKGTSDYEIKKKAILVFCADNGVVEEGVTQTGQEVTAIVAAHLALGTASTSIMAKTAGADIFPVDIGMAADVPSLTRPEEKVCRGTRNFAREEAMSREQVWRAIQVGIRRVEELTSQGYALIGTGEMGIGNTTSSSAVAAVLLGCDPEKVTGRGAGLTSEGLARKKRMIEKALTLHQPDAGDVPGVLAKVGGLDIAGLAGAFLGGAIYRVPVIVDGVISAVAALCAVRMAPLVREYLLPSHLSKEPAARMLLKELELSPLLDGGFCLGEGSGTAAVMPLLEMGVQVYHRMETFREMKIRQYEVLK